ncbi:hypothetical protein ACLOJK_036050 [Asimina triloba]
MDISLIDACLDFTRRRKKSLVLLSAVGFSAYGCYKLYHDPSVAQKRRRLVKLLGALVSVAESVSTSAESISLVSRDLSDFLCSDSDEVPTSLRQLSKIARSEEFAASMVRITEALTVGVLRGYNSATKADVDVRAATLQTNSSFSDRVLEKVFSPAGSGFASVVVGSFARNLVNGFVTEGPSGGNSPVGSDSSSKWVNVVCSDKCRDLIADCIQLFVSTAVAVYLDKTMNINTYDELFSGMTNPKHESKVKDMLVSVCSGAVGTLVKTSHQVLTCPDSNLSSNISNSKSPSFAWDAQGEKSSKTSVELKDKYSLEEGKDGGWVDKVSTTLAVPSNRMFLLDVTGKVTFESVKSFLEFFTWKLSDGLRRSVNAVHGEVAGRGLEVMRYAGAKSVVIATICFALCLHVLLGTRVLARGS